MTPLSGHNAQGPLIGGKTGTFGAFVKAFVCLVLLVALGGCTLFESKATRALRNSPDYRAGYTDGCDSAGGDDAAHRDTSRRDDDAYASNRAYRMGFGAGLGACRPQTPMNGMGGGGPNAIPPTGP